MGTLFIRGYRIEYDDIKDRCAECRRYEAMTNEQLEQVARITQKHYIERLNTGWGTVTRKLPRSWLSKGESK